MFVYCFITCICRISESNVYRNTRLEAVIKECEPSSEVCLNRQHLTDADMEIVIREAINNQQCKSLSLGLNEITSRGASILANALHNNSTLRELWLSTNHLSDSGVYYLAQALLINKTIKKLGLASNDITNTGVSYLVEMLKKNQTLQTLGLAINKIGDQGVQLLANILAQQSSILQTLTLDRNPLVTDLSVNSLISMIKHNRSLSELWINDCGLSEKGKKKLQEAAESNKALKLFTAKSS